MRHPRAFLALAFVAAWTAACGTPPDKEIQQAEAAIETARVAGAADYARDEFTAAENALKNARDAVTQRDYRLALNHALDSRDRARTATRQADERRTAARTAAEQALNAANVALADTRAKMKAAEARRLPARSLVEPRRTVASAEETLQEARSAFERNDFAAATEGAKSATSRLQAVARSVERATTPVPRRRR